MTGLIAVEHLAKQYKVPHRDPGILSAVKSLIQPRYLDVQAVHDVTFTVDSGEMVGLIGPNGAGKTTTLKMLAGLLYPSAGTAKVAGYVPCERHPGFLKNISLVMGNKTQLNWDNTIMDSFLILRDIYSVLDSDFRVRFDELLALLDLEDLLPKMARNLSLGERARCEVAAALIHQPRLLFLDEPTLGLDTTMQLRLREFIRTYNRRYGTTVILTSHYMADIESLCSRVILINGGKLAYDGDLNRLAEQAAPYKLVKTSLVQETPGGDPPSGMHTWPPFVTVVEQDGPRFALRVHKDEVVSLLAYLMNTARIADLTVEDPPIEAVIDLIYREGVQV